ACGSSERSCLVDCATGRVLHRFTGRPLYFNFTPDGKTVFASEGSRLRVWDVASGKELHDRPGEFGAGRPVALRPGGLLAAGGWGQQVVGLWDTTSGRRVGVLPVNDEGRYLQSLAFSADGKGLVACSSGGLLQFWDVAGRKEQRTLQLRDPQQQGQPG